jgi:hypothetical protein
VQHERADAHRRGQADTQRVFVAECERDEPHVRVVGRPGHPIDKLVCMSAQPINASTASQPVREASMRR